MRKLREKRHADTVERTAFVLHSTVGYQLHGWIHRCETAGTTPNLPRPAIVLCPGIDDGADSFVGTSNPVSADEIARLGFVVARFDPAGRGKSWGNEDFGGQEHQDNVATIVKTLAARPDVDQQRIGLLAISLGIGMAVGAAALPSIGVAWILDWEGPCDREIITAGGTMMVPAAGHRLDDNAYWHPREAVRTVGQLRCAYVRIQAKQDHAQPGETRHAMRMIRAADSGDLPWFQLNNHARGEIPKNPQWIPNGRLSANQAILKKLKQLRHESLQTDATATQCSV